MKTGDLVRFKPPVAPHTGMPFVWPVGLLIKYESWEKIGTILYEGKIYRIRAENIQKAGKRDYEGR